MSPEGTSRTTQQLHTALSNQLDRALQEALDKPGPSCLRKQGGGDREPTPGPQALKQGELNLATEKWFLEPNKVRFMDEPDTYRANVGRHRETQPRLVRAKPTLTWCLQIHQHPLTERQTEATGSKELQATPQGIPPLTPQPTRNCQAWRCLKHHQFHWNQK